MRQDVFAEVGRQARGGHAMLAQLEDAALKAKGGDTKGAIAVYDALIAETARPIRPIAISPGCWRRNTSSRTAMRHR